jgi:hypothetical protein
MISEPKFQNQSTDPLKGHHLTQSDIINKLLLRSGSRSGESVTNWPAPDPSYFIKEWKKISEKVDIKN